MSVNLALRNTAGIQAANDAKPTSPLRLVEHHDDLDSVCNPPSNATDQARLTPSKHKRNFKRVPSFAPIATNVVRGFHTASSPGAESIDDVPSPMLTPQLGGYAMSRQSSNTSSVSAIRPAGGYAMSRQGSNSSAVSVLKSQLDALALSDQLGRPGVLRQNSMGGDSTMTMSSSTSVSDRTELETYEVSLEHDFISPDLCTTNTPSRLMTIEGGTRTDSNLNRKMSSADFHPLKCLGKGAFGTVHLVKHKSTGRLFAQKQFRKATLTVHKRLVEQTRTERNILESVNRHPFVVKLYYAFQDHEKLYLILEYAQGGELFTHLAAERMFSEDVAAFYVAEMILALQHLHTTVRVIYRDLKPENCLLDASGHLLLTDFGLSKVALEDDADAPCNSILGTIEYMAPEVISGANYGMAVDWWSLGAICFDLLTGTPPFQGGNHAKISQNIVKQKLQLPYYLGPDAKDFLTRLLRKEPAKRLGGHMPRDMKTIKSHRFFRKIEWKKLEMRELEPPIRPLVTDPELAENFAKEFTDLQVDVSDDEGAEPIGIEMAGMERESDPFGGFSYVASQSLLDHEMSSPIED